MLNARLSCGVIAVVAVASIFALTGCSSVTSVDSVESGASAQVLVTKTADCPTVDEVSEQIVTQLWAVCWGSSPHKSWGAENSCSQRTIGKMLNSHKSCFSSDEMKEIRDRVRAARSTPDPGKTVDDLDRESE